MEESRLRGYLELWQTLLYYDPQNEAKMFAIKDLQSQLQTLTYRKEDGRRIRSRTRWMKSGDRMNKYFFPLVKERPMVGLITKLYDEDDTFVSLRAYLAMVCNTLYS